MLKINEWKRFDEINLKEIPKSAGIYEFWIESDSTPKGKHYYGQTNNLKSRFKQYRNNFKEHKNPKSHNRQFNWAVRKYNTVNLYYRIRVVVCSYDVFKKNPMFYRSILDDLEVNYIFNALDDGEFIFNANSGGKGNDWFDLLSEEEQFKFILQRSKLTSVTGIFHVFKKYVRYRRKKFAWIYKSEDKSEIQKSSLKELEKEVKSRGLEWIIIDEEKAINSFKVDEELEKILPKGKSSNACGILYVYKKICKSCKKGFIWQYNNSKYGFLISNTILKKLEKEVKSHGFEWTILDEDKAKKSYEEDEEIEKQLCNGLITNTSGILYVSKVINKKYKKGYFWNYKQRNNDIDINLASLKELEKEVKSHGFEWTILDEEKAKKSYEEDEQLEKTIYDYNVTNTSGILYVFKLINKKYKKEFLWCYSRRKPKTYFCRNSLRDLEDEARSRGLEWTILDEEKANNSYNEDEELEKLLSAEITNSSGIAYVYKSKNKSYKKGFVWKYNDRKDRFGRSSLRDLEDEARFRGLEWTILDAEKAWKSYEEDEQLEKELPKGSVANTSGILYVCKSKDKRYKKGFFWRYDDRKDRFGRPSLKKLEDEARSRGLEWTILDEGKARKSYEEDEELEKKFNGF